MKSKTMSSDQQKIWLSLSCGILVVLVLSFAFLSRKPLCIDSKLVERIDSVTSEGTFSAYRCGLHQHVPFNSQLSAQAQDLSRRLQKLEKFLDWLGPLKKRITLTVIEESDHFFRIQEQSIFLGEQFLRSQNQFERVLIKYWIRQKMNDKNLADSSNHHSLFVESLTDLLFFSYQGNFQVQDVRTGIYLDKAPKALWPEVLNYTSAYCLDPWKMNEDISRCLNVIDQVVSQSTQEPKKIEYASVRPLLSESLMAAFEQLSGSEKINWLRKLSIYITSQNQIESEVNQDQINNLKVQDQEHQSSRSEFEIINEIQSNIENILKVISQVDDSALNAKMTFLISEQLKQRGLFEVSKSHEDYDFLISLDQIDSKLQKQIEGLDPRHKIAFIENGNRVNNLSSRIPVNEKSETRARFALLAFCGDIHLDQVLRVGKNVERLTLAQICPNSQVNLRSFFEQGIQGLAKENSDLKFIEFHMPSLRLAMKRTPSLERIKSIQPDKIESLLFGSLGWQTPDYNQSLKFYRSKSVIEAIDAYRL